MFSIKLLLFFLFVYFTPPVVFGGKAFVLNCIFFYTFFVVVLKA